MLRKMVRDFATKELAPKMAEIDEEERFPKEDIKPLSELGLFGLTIPEEYGGTNVGEVGFCIVLEELSRAGCSTYGELIGAHNGIGCLPIVMYGTKEQKEKYLPKLATGENIACFALTEPQAGSDAANIQMSAKKEGDFYILNGTKIFITNGPYSNVIITMAVTDRALGARGGVTAFIVENSYEGFSVGTIEKKMGNRGSKCCELIYDNVKVPAENVLGKVGEGFRVALAALDDGRVSLGAGALGAAKGALDLATKYSKQRVQFGKPICENQAIQWMLANTAIKIRAAEYMVYHTASKVQEAIDCRALKGEEPPRLLREELSRDAAIVKVFCSEMAWEAIDNALQIYGGYGYMREYNIERALRDSRVMRIYEGTNEIQRMIIAKEILNRDGWGD